VSLLTRVRCIVVLARCGEGGEGEGVGEGEEGWEGKMTVV
jgi:hypothetical protein